MTFQEIISTRHSVRKYLPKPVEEEKIAAILEAARLAPSAKNLQPIKIAVLKTEGELSKLSNAANIYSAPLAFVVFADKSAAWERPFDGKRSTDIDATIATDHMMLKATELGLGSVWICFFKPDVIRAEFDIPDSLEPINVLAVGYPDEASVPEKRRKPLEEILL